MRLSEEKRNELYDFIYNYPTFRKEGFLPDEQTLVLEKYQKLYPNFNLKKYDDAMMGNTCMMYKGKFVMYHCDVHKAVQCGIEERDLMIDEWD